MVLVKASLAPQVLLSLLSGVHSQITLFTPGTGMVPRRTVVAATAAIGRLLLAVVAIPTACTSAVATSTPGRVTTASTAASQSAAWLGPSLRFVSKAPETAGRKGISFSRERG